MTPEIKARIDADMATVPGMSLRQALTFLDGYTARYDPEIRQGEVTRAAIRAYADEALRRAREASEERPAQ